MKRINQNRKKFIIYPQNRCKDNWDLYVAALLIVACTITPVRIAFVQQETGLWLYINWAIDICFLLDILIIFNTAFYD